MSYDTLKWSRQQWPEGPDGGESLHRLGEVGQQRELGAVLQLLQVPEWKTGGRVSGSSAAAHSSWGPHSRRHSESDDSTLEGFILTSQSVIKQLHFIHY